MCPSKLGCPDPETNEDHRPSRPGQGQHDDSGDDHDQSERADPDAPRELTARPTAHKRTDSDEPPPRSSDNRVPISRSRARLAATATPRVQASSLAKVRFLLRPMVRARAGRRKVAKA